MGAEARHTTSTTIKKLVGRLRGSSMSVSSPSSLPGDDGGEASSRTGTFLMRSSRSSPDSQGRKRSGQDDGNAQLALKMWNGVYDSLRDDPSCAGLVIAYETIISQELPDHLKTGGMNSSFRSRSADDRLELLEMIASSGLAKRRGSNTSQADDMAKSILDSARGQVEAAIAETTAASIAWAGLCTLTPLLLDPIVQRDSFRHGLVHIIDRIPWYTNLSQVLVAGSWEGEQEFWSRHQGTVSDSVMGLSRRVLEFEMNCVCAAGSAWNAGAKNVVRWSTMDQLVQDIIDLDSQLSQVIEQNGTLRTKDSLLGSRKREAEEEEEEEEEAEEAAVAHQRRPLRATARPMTTAAA